MAYYRKALELDPDNETYKSNLKVAELRLREAPSPVSPLGTGRGGRAARGRGLGLTRVGGTSLVPGARHLFITGSCREGRGLSSQSPRKREGVGHMGKPQLVRRQRAGGCVGLGKELAGWVSRRGIG